jgi:heme/copper-type cytochrome/quinol oxidase subunit 2
MREDLVTGIAFWRKVPQTIRADMVRNSLFSPVSPQASSITHLSIVVAVVMLAILALVTFLVLYAVVRFRRRPWVIGVVLLIGS